MISKLDRPEDVWRDEFRNRLEETDRLLMNTLYSLADSAVNNDTLEKAFNKRIRAEDRFDTSNNPYRNSLIRLSGSLIQNVEGIGLAKVSVINPSINDYMRSELHTNVSEQVKIIQSAHFFEQCLKVTMSDEARNEIVEMMYSGKFLKMNVYENSIYFYFLKVATSWNVEHGRICEGIRLSLKNASRDLQFSMQDEYGEIINSLINGECFDSCCLEDIFFDPEMCNTIITPMQFEGFEEFVCSYTDKMDKLKDSLRVELTKVLAGNSIEKITDYVLSEIEDNMDAIAEKVVSNNPMDSEDYRNEVSDDLEDILNDAIRNEAHERIAEKIQKMKSKMDIPDEKFDIDEMVRYFNASQILSEVLPKESPSVENEKPSTYADEIKQIVDMFER